MEKLSFEIEINAPAAKVWSVLWDDETYRDWTSPFMEGSYATGEWKLGGRIHFLAPDGRGMFSDIAEFVENEKMSFKHLGSVKNFKELEKAEDWTDSFETYTLKESDGKTMLIAETDCIEAFAEFMNDKFPQAMARVKSLSES